MDSERMPVNNASKWTAKVRVGVMYSTVVVTSSTVSRPVFNPLRGKEGFVSFTFVEVPLPYMLPVLAPCKPLTRIRVPCMGLWSV